ncbi:MAG: efflux RND transporter periplasmic adaptor subunit [Planctomycetota bacterium]|nr:efflux RND transporter periplasmic adaptor subunit [Planctomycetota bacterium]
MSASTQSTTSHDPRFDASAIATPRKHLGTRVGLPVAIIGIAAALILFVSWRQLAPATRVDVVPVVLRPAPAGAAQGPSAEHPRSHRSPTAGTVQAAGWIEPSPLPIYATALEPGVVKEVLVLEGQKVKSGQVLVKLIDEEAHIEVDAADAEMEMIRAELSEANDTLARKSRLAGTDAVSANELVMLAARRDKLMGQLGAADAKRRRADLALDRMTVRSPVDGVIIRVLAAPGSVVGGMEHAPHVVHLYQPDKLQVRADIPNADMGRVQIGLPVEITVDAMPDRVFHGILKRFVSQADTAKNTVEAKVEIADPDPVLRPDMLVRCKVIPMEVFHAGAEHGAGGAGGGPAGAGGSDWVYAPEALLAGDGPERTALVARDVEDGVGIAHSVQVSVGNARPDGWIPVFAGLVPGDALVDFRPHSAIADGSRIRITTRAEPEGGAARPHGTSSATPPANATPPSGAAAPPHILNGGANGAH